MEKNLFTIKYRKVNKPTSTRKFTLESPFPYGMILYEDVMNEICMSVYKTELKGTEMSELINIERIIANQSICVYKIQLTEDYNSSKVIAEYEVEIECLKKNNKIDLTEL
mgnify:CR=1 FL=1